jgi:tRNA-specific 2-thiouridylase
LSHEFKEKVIDYFCAEYIKGHTPNPCVVCNERIKFASLLEKARSLGIYRIATGHYARIEFNKARKRFLLKCAKDGTKDQSYFLFSLSQQQLGSALFPLGGYTKVAVRRAAKRFRLKTYNTPSSQDICFTQGLNYGEYIREKAGMEMKGGDIVHEDGRILGRHKGIPFYTLGQRKGLSVAYKEPLYVTAIDAAKNRVIVGTKRHILRKSLIADRLNWITQDGISRPMKVLAKIRYNHKKAKAVVSREGSGSVRVDFEKPQASPTPGQAVVFYDKDIVIGDGWIRDCPR